MAEGLPNRLNARMDSLIEIEAAHIK